jgi:hypothetical protein
MSQDVRSRGVQKSGGGGPRSHQNRGIRQRYPQAPAIKFVSLAAIQVGKKRVEVRDGTCFKGEGSEMPFGLEGVGFMAEIMGSGWRSGGRL